ncbi:hypothetical protein HMN09_00605600 [Mycena chlorophos]|uniref:Uncharacterized protein n=1 Tax=Mycena chlorophos TaxID=658473 RepID=A0A8H6T423_MYCCL|nr:hypothetical protein HMN09_00605600 [Mycena chlorophos]
MSRLPPPNYPEHSSHYPTWGPDESAGMGHVLHAASRVLDQPPPPSLRDVLGAYKASGDGDREVLLAVLKAKTSEDNRQAAIATLYESMLHLQRMPQQHSYPPPSYPPPPPPSRHMYRSPPRSLPHARSISPRDEPRRKRSRGSESPSENAAELPPSPYSSSADSPRSRGSMTIGSLLATEPRGESGRDEDPDR